LKTHAFFAAEKRERIKNPAPASSTSSAEDWQKAFLQCREVNLQLVTTSLSERLVLGKLLMELMS
jgi:hypothetical protein